MTRFYSGLVGLLLGLGLIASPVIQAQDHVSLNLAEIHVKGYPTEQADEEFARLVGKYTDGALKVTVFSDGQIASDEKAAIEQVQSGALAFTRVSTGSLGPFSARLTVFGLPYLFDSKEHMWSFLNSPYGQKMLGDLASSRIVGLCWYDAGARSFYARVPLRTLDDLKGLRIRTQANPMIMDTVRALGADPVPVGIGQVIGMLESGAIDGAENNPPSLLSLQHYRFARHYMLNNHMRLPEILIMSKVVWDRLTPAHQAAVRKAAADSVAFQRARWDAYEIEALNAVKADGVSVVEVKDYRPFRYAVRGLLAEAATQFPDTLKAISAARNLRWVVEPGQISTP